MGFFGKKEACPVCGGEVKGLFLKKIADKKTLCKNCGSRVSMNEELLKKATPEFVEEHLVYRQKNAEKFNMMNWDREYTSIPGFKVGVSLGERALYMIHDEMNDEDNPVVFSFDQLVGYELYRLNKKVDTIDDVGVTLDTGLTVLATLSSIAGKGGNDADYFILKLKTTEPYWENLELKISFTRTMLQRLAGFREEMQTVCQIFKSAVRKETITL